nr:immunoglobulin light chain junction region [Macaca mulatta]
DYYCAIWHRSAWVF